MVLSVIYSYSPRSPHVGLFYGIPMEIPIPTSNTGTNLKVGGHMSGAKRREKNFSRALYFFGSTDDISRFGERFRGGQYSLASPVYCSSTHSAPSGEATGFAMGEGRSGGLERNPCGARAQCDKRSSGGRYP